MSSTQELYNQLSEKLRDLVPVKNSKQISNWIWIIVGMLQSESCHLGEIANYLPLNSMAESRVTLIRRWLMNPHIQVWRFYKKRCWSMCLQVGKTYPQPSSLMVSCSSEIAGRSFGYRCYMAIGRCPWRGSW